MKLCFVLLLTALLGAAMPAFAASRESLIAEGERALMAGNAIVAERAFVIGMNNYPDDPRFTYYAGIAALYLGRPSDAERRLLLSVEHYPRAEFFLGLIKLDEGDAPAALDHLDRYLKRAPRDPEGELLKGVALLAMSNPKAVDSFNLAAQLDKSLRTHALFFRGLSQFEKNDAENADKALRAVMRLGDQPTLLQLAEQTLDVMQKRGDIASKQWTELYLDTIYDDNINREYDRFERDGLNNANDKDAGLRFLLRGRYWRRMRDSQPALIAGGWFEHDQPIVNNTSARSALGGLFDLGYYRGLDKLSLDPGFEFEPSLALYDGGTGYALNQINLALRPRLYLFKDHERSTKLFYEFRYVSDFDEGFFTGPQHMLGIRPSWTGRNRRTYVSTLVALKADSTDAAAYRALGPKFSLDAQGSFAGGLLLEGTASYHKSFFRQVTPLRQEDTLIGHIGIGWWKPDKKFVFLVGTDQELHLSSELGRNYTVHSYWLRLGAYL